MEISCRRFFLCMLAGTNAHDVIFVILYELLVMTIIRVINYDATLLLTLPMHYESLEKYFVY